ncbi:MAG TPA: glutamate racemase [Firmicutes bacterium]|nr:glutamate racemase [Bacillota bacterium]
MRKELPFWAKALYNMDEVIHVTYENTSPIGIFDSGVGGISVLGRAKLALPHEDFIYYADTAHFPYGDNDPAVIRSEVMRAAETMVEQGAKALVIACNTATSIAIQDLRARFSLPILGMEPALKPAVERCHDKRIAVIATSLTLREKKFRDLFARCRERGDIVNLPAPGLADLVERGHYNDAMGEKFLADLFRGLGHVDGIVLGCTHYLFLLPLIHKDYPGVEIIDGGEGTVRHLIRTLTELHLENHEGEGQIQVLSTAPEIFLPKFQTYLDDITSIIQRYL